MVTVTCARTPVRVYPGVMAFLDLVESRPDEATTGLLTGNIEEGARRKLDAAGIGFDRFMVGAFGSDREDRNELPAVARARAETITGVRFEGKEMAMGLIRPATDPHVGSLPGSLEPDPSSSRSSTRSSTSG